MVNGILARADFDLAIIVAGSQFALYENMSAFDETFRQFGKSIAERICYVESNRPRKQRNTLGMLPFLLKPVDLFGGHRCM